MKKFSNLNLVRLFSVIMSATSIAFLASCATPGEKTGIGAGAGAAGGAIIGAVAGGTKGAAIGAVAGGVLGGSVGNYLDKQANQLKKVADTKRTTDGILVKLKNDLLFDTGSATLKPEAIQQLTELGGILAKYKEDRVKVVGYTDSVGSAQFNEELSQRRAQSVKAILAGQGVNETQVSATGFGKQSPVATNASAEGRAQNRRVELHIDVPNAKKSG